VSITGQLYQSMTPDGNQFMPVPGAQVNLSPGLTGVVTVGQTATGTVTGLAIPIIQGTRLMMVYTMTVGGLPMATVVNGTISGGINIQ
jgi:BclB C-terminal domain-containing protein